MSTDFSQWVGKTETVQDQVRAAPLASLSVTLDRDDAYPQPGDVVPPLWHWLFFLPLHRHSQLGPEGHAEFGGFMPPSRLPRRMWAGGRFEFHHPLRVGDAITRESRIVAVTAKAGRTGPLLFVVVRHEVSNEQGIALVEEHDIVYRDHTRPGAPQPAPQPAPSESRWKRQIEPDEILLFRYSALTFNAHRIHYDRRYATQTEGYAGLVVHGPLVATLLLELLRQNLPEAEAASFEFRAVSALFDTGPFWVCGQYGSAPKDIRLWASRGDGGLGVSARTLLR
jgi:3-methylfumaryl-CoA hydratase